MKKINFSSDVLPHLVAIVVFLVITIMFFRPVFFENRVLNQGDITQFLWSSKELRDFRETQHEEGLWAGAMFSGMPAYMINLDWSDGVVTTIKRVLSFYMPHPVNNIFLAFVSFYILLLSFRVRPYIAIAGAIAFGLSSYMIVGLSAGHNARVGAVALMPLVVAGIHLTFTGRRILGFGVTALGMALHLRENHLQITYYLAIMVGLYGLVQLVYAFREKKLPELAKNVGVLIVAVVIAVGTFFGQLWAAGELAKYSTRGKTELSSSSADVAGNGLPKSYAFAYSNGPLEPITLLIPNIYGGSSSESVLTDQNSATYRALVQSNDNQMANQLAQFATAYWGPQPLATPYYAGAIIVFLFVVGLFFVDRKYVWWLAPIVVLSIMMSWGSTLEWFNYFLFDYFPAYNKFRSVTFSMIMALFAMPLLGCMGLEAYLKSSDSGAKRKLLWAFGIVGGFCLIFVIMPGMLNFAKSFESQLPPWFLSALQSDRQSLLRSDAFRSLAFIASIFIMLYLNVPKKISPMGFFVFLSAMVAFDSGVVDSRYFTRDRNYQHKRAMNNFEANGADLRILKDKSYYRVYNINEFYDASTSNFHNSLGGYSAVRLKRYQELYDSCLIPETQELVRDANAGQLDLTRFGVLNMLNTKYLVYGTDSTGVIRNRAANGNAWFVREILPVKSANEELSTLRTVNTRNVAVVDEGRVKLTRMQVTPDSAASIQFIEKKPYWQKYESNSTVDGLAVFSEIYYPEGWSATIDGQQVPIHRVDYILRALEVPAGKHTIEFTFAPKAYVVGDKVTMASSWILLLVVLGSLFMEFKGKKEEVV